MVTVKVWWPAPGFYAALCWANSITDIGRNNINIFIKTAASVIDLTHACRMSGRNAT